LQTQSLRRPDFVEPPVVLDLQGAKMRLGELPSCEQLPTRVTLIWAESSETIAELPVPHRQLFESVKAGELLWLNDARVELCVERAADERIEARVVRNGPLSSKKGINRPHHPIAFRALSAADRRAIEIAEPFAFTEYAFSFVFDGKEAALLRQQTERRLTAKIERPEAMAFLQEIASCFDALWLCRGDLGAQGGIFALAEHQRRFAELLPTLGKPGFLAGQVLEHLTHHALPTRSEVVHLLDAQKAGFRGIVLSDETAIGRHIESLIAFLKAHAHWLKTRA
jgi:pyruvate kinase